MRGFFSSRLRWLTVAVCERSYFRPEPAEFPVAYQCACKFLERPLRGRRAAGCASIDALRSHIHSVNIHYPHEISFIREATAAFARWLSPKGRSPFAFSRNAG